MSGSRVAEQTTETRFDRIGIPNSIRWGFLAVLVFMSGNAVETNFIAPHMKNALPSHQAIVPTIISLYGLAVLIGSYLAGALSDLYGPRRVMTLGFVVWIVFQVLFLLSLSVDSVPFVFITYFLRGFGYPLFAFSFLVWISTVVPFKRNGTAVGWFYVMFTGGLPTFGSLFAVAFIAIFGGGYAGETGAMWLSMALVAVGFVITFLIRDPYGSVRLASEDESKTAVMLGGLRLCVKEPVIFIGFCVRIINTAPEYGMFVILPGVIGGSLGWSQSQWLLMGSYVYGSNIAFNAVFGAIGDRWGWVRTVRWFGVAGSSLGLLAWWYVPHWVQHGSTWGYVVSVAAGISFGILLAGFVPLGAILPSLTEDKGAAMAMYTTAAGGAAFLGSAVVAAVVPWGGNAGVVWAFVGLYAVSFVLCHFLRVPKRAPTATTATAPA